MNKKELIKTLENYRQEWQDMLESQGEDWQQYDVQIGEIQGLEFAIDIIKGVKFE